MRLLYDIKIGYIGALKQPGFLIVRAQNKSKRSNFFQFSQ